MTKRLYVKTLIMIICEVGAWTVPFCSYLFFHISKGNKQIIAWPYYKLYNYKIVFQKTFNNMKGKMTTKKCTKMLTALNSVRRSY